MDRLRKRDRIQECNKGTRGRRQIVTLSFTFMKSNLDHHCGVDLMMKHPMLDLRLGGFSTKSRHE